MMIAGSLVNIKAGDNEWRRTVVQTAELVMTVPLPNKKQFILLCLHPLTCTHTYTNAPAPCSSAVMHVTRYLALNI